MRKAKPTVSSKQAANHCCKQSKDESCKTSETQPATPVEVVSTNRYATPQEMDRANGGFIHLLTVTRLSKFYDALSKKAMNRYENDAISEALEKEICADPEIITMLQKFGEIKNATDFGQNASFIQIFSERPAVVKLFAQFDAMAKDISYIQRCYNRMVGSHVTQNMPSGFLEMLSYSAKNLFDIEKEVTSWWDNCERTFAPGVFKIRHSTAKNALYNPEGITLLCVLHEITRAMQPELSVIGYARSIEFSGIVPGWNEPVSAEWKARRFGRIAGVDCLLDEDGDGIRANFIRVHPSALLFSPEHQEAVARWTYAKRCGSVAERKLAQKALDAAIDKKSAGRRPRCQIDSTFLRQAQHDIAQYVSGFNRAMMECNTIDAVRNVFPDCDFLFLDPSSELASSQIEDMFRVRTKIKFPETRQEAVRFIARHTGLQKTRIYELLKEKPPGTA